MNGHLTETLIGRYREQVLPPAELLDADDHLAGCEICRQLLNDEQRLEATSQSLRRDLSATGLTHLTYEHLVSYVDGDLDQTDREIVDSHLKLCERCSDELNDLRAFATETAAYPAKEYGPRASSSVPQKLLKFIKGSRERTEGSWRRSAFWIPVEIASLALIVALLVGTGVLLSRRSQLQMALDAERQENEKLKQDYQVAIASSDDLHNQLAQLKSPELPVSSNVVTLNDGLGQVTLDEKGNLTGVPAEYQQSVKQTLTSQQIVTPHLLSELIGKSGVLMGPAEEGHPIALLGPVGTVVINVRPVFRWRAIAGAEGYVVRIYDADFNEVAASPQLSGTAWTANRALERGQNYSWQVTALVGAKEIVSPVKPAPDAKFMVLNQTKANELAHAKNASGNSHLTLGILYAQSGLLDDAEREFQMLLRANPQSTLVHKLLRIVREKRRSA
ncbi:MAG TPA: zf-HC2 domain-containing protein [Pyrinomonadaceae bacterium]